jgi:hypothetical protein
MRIIVPADTTMRTLTIFAGVWSARGKIVAALSDASATDYTDISLESIDSIDRGQYTFSYRAASPGQTLTITYTVDQSYASNWGNVTVQAATLQ